ncbi:hypothetical protein DRO19_02740 [Candidatus Bathyarchaeota archaeon]|nr:MAG: hypothetical protein DRO19_02740 [Candidatus Bathyarchaeota archaeon]
MKIKEVKRMNASTLGLVVMLITLAVILPIGLIVVGNLNSTISNMDLGSQGNQTRTSLFNNIYSAMNLAVIIPIVAAAGAIIGIVIYYLGRTQT